MGYKSGRESEALDMAEIEKNLSEGYKQRFANDLKVYQDKALAIKEEIRESEEVLASIDLQIQKSKEQFKSILDAQRKEVDEIRAGIGKDREAVELEAATKQAEIDLNLKELQAEKESLVLLRSKIEEEKLDLEEQRKDINAKLFDLAKEHAEVDQKKAELLDTIRTKDNVLSEIAQAQGRAEASAIALDENRKALNNLQRDYESLRREYERLSSENPRLEKEIESKKEILLGLEKVQAEIAKNKQKYELLLSGIEKDKESFIERSNQLNVLENALKNKERDLNRREQILKAAESK